MSYLMNCGSHGNGIASYCQIIDNMPSVMLYYVAGPNMLLAEVSTAQFTSAEPFNET